LCLSCGGLVTDDDQVGQGLQAHAPRVQRAMQGSAPAATAGGIVATAFGCVYPANLTKHGGGSAPQMTLVNVLWGSNVPFQVLSTANALYGALARPSAWNPYLSSLGEYGALGVAKGATVTITPQNYNPATTYVFTDSQIQSELSRQVGLGTLVPGISYLYMVHLPPNVTISDNGGSCVPLTGFCAYHSLTSVSGGSLYYAVVPDFASSACSSICGEFPSGITVSQAQQMVESHEIAETLTDPDTQSGWLDNNQPAKCGNEIGDVCNQLPAQISGGDGTLVTVQRLWSNAAQDCVVSNSSPEIVSLSPSTGPEQGGQTITITGNRFATGVGQTRFAFGGSNYSQSSYCASTTSCTAVVPPYVVTNGTNVVVTANKNGLESSFEGTQDNFTYFCQPTTCTAGFCGSMSDGCGGSLNCFPCAAGSVCYQNACCSKRTQAVACGTKTCGTVTDGCGGIVTCGPTCPCVPNPDPCANRQCGIANDGCGGPNVSCGTCPLRQACNAGTCEFVRSCGAGLVFCGGECVKPNFCQ
jgi:hypothetical protein